MTEDQILQRVAESQKRVFNDIDQSKQTDPAQGFQVVGANGLTVQQQGNQIAISATELTGVQVLNGEDGERGPIGQTGIQGVSVEDVSVNPDLSFTFTLSDGSSITTEALITGEGVLASEGGGITVLQTQSCN